MVKSMHSVMSVALARRWLTSASPTNSFSYVLIKGDMPKTARYDRHRPSKIIDAPPYSKTSGTLKKTGLIGAKMTCHEFSSGLPCLKLYQATRLTYWLTQSIPWGFFRWTPARNRLTSRRKCRQGQFGDLNGKRIGFQICRGRSLPLAALNQAGLSLKTCPCRRQTHRRCNVRYRQVGQAIAARCCYSAVTGVWTGRGNHRASQCTSQL